MKYDYILGQSHSKNYSLEQQVTGTLSQTSLVYHYNDGTTCDLNGLPREAKIKLKCHPQKDHLISVVETSSCKYEALIETYRLCQSKRLQPVDLLEKKKWHCHSEDLHVQELFLKKSKEQQD